MKQNKKTSKKVNTITGWFYAKDGSVKSVTYKGTFANNTHTGNLHNSVGFSMS